MNHVLVAGLTSLALASSSLASGAQTLSADDRVQIEASIAARGLGIEPAARGHRAVHTGQGLTARFEAGAARIESTGGRGTWSFGLALSSYGFEGSLKAVDAPSFGACTSGAELTYGWDDTLSEWWVNDPRGFEHGFDVHARPAGGQGGPLALELEVEGSLEPVLNPSRTGLELRQPDGALALRYDGLFALDATGAPLDAWFELDGSTLTILVDEADATYPIVIDPIASSGYLKASNAETFDRFGSSVAASGDTVVVGAPQEDSIASGVNGFSADNSSSDSGAAYVFVRSGGTWIQEAYLKASNTGAGDLFGGAVATSGDTIVVGARNEGSDATGVNGDQFSNAAPRSGAVYVFTRTAGTWSQQAYIKASNTDQFDGFGIAVSIDGDTLVVGAEGEDSASTSIDGDGSDNSANAAGAAYVFTRSGGTWTQQAYLKAANAEAADTFGGSVAVFGDTVVVGASGEDSGAITVNGDASDNSAFDAGAAYVFRRSGTSWSQEAYLKAPNAEALDAFGLAVAVSGDLAVVGAPREDGGATGIGGDLSDNSEGSAGAAYVFDRTGGAWSFGEYLKASNAESQDDFGGAVAALGDAVLVGAIGDDSGTSGVNAGPPDDFLQFAGAAYLFRRAADAWSEQAYLKASNPDSGDTYGTAVALSTQGVFVGAQGEGSAATTVGGDQSDNSAGAAGAVYALPGLTAAGIGHLICIGNQNSTGEVGTLTAVGSTAVADGNLVLEVACCPPNTFGLMATTNSNGGPLSTVPLGVGRLCISNGQIGRFPILSTDAGGAATQVVDLAAIPTSNALVAALPGERFDFQFWHRDIADLTQTSNLTRAISVTFE